MSEPLIDVAGLTKRFRVSAGASGAAGGSSTLRSLVARRRVVTALDGVSFHIAAGELVGYIGPNGAGKSTTVKILSGILVPDAGRCVVAGRVPWRERVAHVAGIGVVFGQRSQLWWDLPVIESFDLLRDIYRLEPAAYRSTRDELVDLLAIAPLLAVPVRQLSLGQRMRCELAAALLHRPRLLFLDEPTIGLDAVAKLAVRDIIRRLHRRGVTTILTTHDLDDVEALCPRVLVIGAGSILFDGSVADLRAGVDRERILTVDLEHEVGSFSTSSATVVSAAGRRVVLRYDPARIPTPRIIEEVARDNDVRDLYIEPQPIDELVARLYRDLELEEA
ncbi:MAG: ATP-binding cassette domain-containing protein [Spirochaetaceae bacterium]|nr:ATP-binding cassette domain-containing protein [Spirochaetaceae bacterium]